MLCLGNELGLRIFVDPLLIGPGCQQALGSITACRIRQVVILNKVVTADRFDDPLVSVLVSKDLVWYARANLRSS